MAVAVYWVGCACDCGRGYGVCVDVEPAYFGDSLVSLRALERGTGSSAAEHVGTSPEIKVLTVHRSHHRTKSEDKERSHVREHHHSREQGGSALHVRGSRIQPFVALPPLRRAVFQAHRLRVSSLAYARHIATSGQPTQQAAGLPASIQPRHSAVVLVEMPTKGICIFTKSPQLGQHLILVMTLVL